MQRLPALQKLGFQQSLHAAGFGAAVGDTVVMAVEAQDEHGAAVHVATGLIGSGLGSDVAFGVDVAGALSEAAAAEFLCAAEEVHGVVGVFVRVRGSQGAAMFASRRARRITR